MEKDIIGIMPCPNCVCFYCDEHECPHMCSKEKQHRACNEGSCPDRDYECQKYTDPPMDSEAESLVDKLQQQWQDTCQIRYGAIGIDAKCHIEVDEHGQTLLVTEPVPITSIDIGRLKEGKISTKPGLHSLMETPPEIKKRVEELNEWFKGIRKGGDGDAEERT